MGAKLTTGEKTAIAFRPMQVADVPQVVALQTVAFSHPWTEQMLRAELGHAHSTVLLAEGPGQSPSLVGFAVYWVVLEELQLLNIASSPTHRRLGVGRALLTEVLRRARVLGCHRATLEVRVGNEPARRLYRSAGFLEVGLRKAYYRDNREDAVLMEMRLGPPGIA